MLATYLPLLLAWLLFGFIHSAMATAYFKKLAGRILKNNYRYYRLLYSLIATISLCWVLRIHFSIQESKLWRAPWYQSLIGGIGVIAGLAIMLICIRKYFVYLSGIGVFLNEQRVSSLERSGLHAYVRHPLYSGTLLFVWSIFVGYPYLNNFISCACITIYTLVGMYFEEKKLIIEYGNDYLNYRSRVPALIPRF